MRIRKLPVLSALVLLLGACTVDDSPFPSQFKRLIATAEDGAVIDPSVTAPFQWERLHILNGANYPDAAIRDLRLRADTGVWLAHPTEAGSVFLFVSDGRPVQVVFVPEWVAVCKHLNGVSLSAAEARFVVSGRYQGQPPRSLSLAPRPSRTSQLRRPSPTTSPVA
jgi:hypothetical protein